MKRIIALILVLCLCFSMPVFAAENENPVIEQGTIASATGLVRDDTTRVRTADYLKLSDYAAVFIGEEYQMTNFVYDSEYTYLGTSSWLKLGGNFKIQDLLSAYPNGVYFKFAVRKSDQSPISPEDVANMGLVYYKAGDKLPEIKVEFTNEAVMQIGGWQEGAIFDGKLFTFSKSNKGKVYDLESKTEIGAITLEKGNVLSPHANSVCFGTEYYDSNDKYPLLYVNVYNNYASAEDRLEGVCCVYRITGELNAYKGELVQVIKIGFVEDLNLWKSVENNGDVRPYGNFCVDTDNSDLYAFVMRDKNKTTRFFKFELPKLCDGIYNDTYGCNVLTLQAEDIKDQFDTGYFNFLQGCDYLNGRIISSEGFGGQGTNQSAIRVVDLATKTVIKTYYTAEAGVTNEAEVLAVDNKNGKVYYAATDGMLRLLTFMDNYKPATNDPTLYKEFDGKWYYYVNGLRRNDTTLVKYSGKWFYVNNGKWDKTACDLVKYQGKWFYVEKGKWNGKTATLFKKNGKWFSVKSGKWYKGETIISYSGKKFYVNRGFAKLKYSGTVKINNKKYKIKNGKVV